MRRRPNFWTGVDAAQFDRSWTVHFQLDHATGIRDLTILYERYAPRLRDSEVCRLRLHAIDTERGIVTVRRGNRNKDHFVPILKGGRPGRRWVRREPPADLELRVRRRAVPDGPGREITENSMTQLVRDHIRADEIEDRGRCHAFRHSAAAGMLDNDADIRAVQAQLGCADIATTQIYTFGRVAKLKRVHGKARPLAAGRKREQALKPRLDWMSPKKTDRKH